MKILLWVCCILFAVFFFVHRDRRPPIYHAGAQGDTNYIAKYLASGSNVNNGVISYIYGHLSAPLLCIAVEYGQIDTVEFLLDNGANPNEFDSSGKSILSTALNGCRNEVNFDRSLDILKLLLKRGADPNLKEADDYHYPPLLRAAYGEQTAPVEILLAAGADVNATNSEGQSSLHFARTAEIAKILVAAGANLSAVAHTETPADTALRDGRLDVLSVLTNATIKTK